MKRLRKKGNGKGLLPQHKAFIDIIFEWDK